MEPEEKARLRALCEAATPGPWEAWQTVEAEPVVSVAGRQMFGVVARPNYGREDYGKADAEFIAAAREALPALLAEDTSTVVDTLRRAARLAREAERLGFLFIEGTHERVPWEAVARWVEGLALPTADPSILRDDEPHAPFR